MALRTVLSLRSDRRPRLEGRTIEIQRKTVLLLLVLVIALPLVACGKRASPEPPPGEKSTYPKIYPNPNEQP